MARIRIFKDNKLYLDLPAEFVVQQLLIHSKTNLKMSYTIRVEIDNRYQGGMMYEDIEVVEDKEV